MFKLRPLGYKIIRELTLGEKRFGDLLGVVTKNPTQLSEALKALEREGLIHYRPDEKDRRAKVYYLTDKAKKTEYYRQKLEALCDYDIFRGELEKLLEDAGNAEDFMFDISDRLGFPIVLFILHHEKDFDVMAQTFLNLVLPDIQRALEDRRISPEDINVPYPYDSREVSRKDIVAYINDISGGDEKLKEQIIQRTLKD